MCIKSQCVILGEDVPVGTVVYTLKGVDPEGAKVLYTISGDNFSVDRETGVITLRSPLDREREELLDVVVTVQDEAYEHIVPFRRQIKGTCNLHSDYTWMGVILRCVCNLLRR